jgi:hypothetical protein
MANRTTSTLLNYPPTWLVVLTLCGLEWAFISWFRPPLSVVLISLGVTCGLLVAWPVILLRSKAFLKVLYDLPDSLKSDRREKFQTLESDLEDVRSAQGLEQLRLLRDKLETLSEVLKRRMNAGELTYGRYLNTAEQVFLAAMDNLHEIAVALTSVRTIDSDYIESRLSKMSDGDERGGERHREIETLTERRTLLEQQMQKVSELFAQNEAAMTALDNTATALADVRTGKGHASMDAEAAMAELEKLAERAGKYSADHA